MKVYFNILKGQILKDLQYKSVAISGVLTQFFWGFMYMFLYEACYSNGIIVNGFEFHKLVSYVWLNQIFFSFFFGSILNKSVVSEIKSGDISYKFVRPMNLYNYWFAGELSTRISNFICRSIPLAIVVWFLPAKYRISLPINFEAFCLFVLSIVVGILLITAIAQILLIIVFRNKTDKGVTACVTTFISIAAGSYIPIPLLPEFLQKIFNFMPFRYVFDLPYRIYIGNIVGTDALIQVSIQLVWLVGIVILGKFLTNRQLRKIEIQGG